MRNENLDLVTFTKHLSVMIAAGIPLNEALSSLIAQAKSGPLRKALEDILAKVTEGSSLNKALRAHHNFFNDYYVSFVEIGEESGTLEENLKYLSDQLAKDQTTGRKFRTALLYPGVVLLFAFIIGGGISIFVLPKLVDLFSAFDIPLPVTTRILISFATLMKNSGILIFSVIILLIAVFSVLIRLPFIKPITDRIALRLPLVGNILATYQVTRLCRNLGTMLKSGVPVLNALQVCSRSLSNSEFSSALKNIAKNIESGQNLSASFEKYSIFPPLLTNMIKVGEQSGKLDESFLYLAEFYDAELDDLTKNLETVLEPILLVIIGIIVGFLALAIISPIYQLTGSIGVTTP